MAYVRSENSGGGNISSGTYTASSSNSQTIVCGFKPKKIFYYADMGTNLYLICTYDEDISNTTMLASYKTSSSSYGVGVYTIGASNSNILNSVNNDGFTVRPVLSAYNGKTINYTAIG